MLALAPGDHQDALTARALRGFNAELGSIADDIDDMLGLHLVAHRAHQVRRIDVVRQRHLLG